MKQPTQETTQQNSTQGKKYDSIGLDYFYNKYNKGNNPKISKRLFRKIIQAFFKVYFGELYAFKTEKYFFLGGKMKLVIGQGRVFNNHLKRIITNHINLFWYFRPSAKTYYEVKLRKLAGGTSSIKAIERFYMKNYNKDLLPIFTKEQEKGKRNKILFRCIQT